MEGEEEGDQRRGNTHTPGTIGTGTHATDAPRLGTFATSWTKERCFASDVNDVDACREPATGASPRCVDRPRARLNACIRWSPKDGSHECSQQIPWTNRSPRKRPRNTWPKPRERGSASTFPRRTASTRKSLGPTIEPPPSMLASTPSPQTSKETPSRP
eukprot:scaffold301_cov370-Pavlova_lutheri.AAC.13